MGKLEDFGFKAVDSIPGKKPKYEEILSDFMNQGSAVMAAEMETKAKASSMVTGLKKAAKDMGIEIDVCSRANTVYIEKM